MAKCVPFIWLTFETKSHDSTNASPDSSPVDNTISHTIACYIIQYHWSISISGNVSRTLCLVIKPPGVVVRRERCSCVCLYKIPNAIKTNLNSLYSFPHAQKQFKAMWFNDLLAWIQVCNELVLSYCWRFNPPIAYRIIQIK